MRIFLEGSEEYKKAIQEYNHTLEKYYEFECKFAGYVLFNNKADEEIFKIWKSLQKWVSAPKDYDVRSDNKVCLITYLEENWNAWLKSILDEDYSYMNLTKIVWESWEEC